jgi:CMP/dCMP kinase
VRITNFKNANAKKAGMIITIAGDAGSGKSTVAKLVAKKLRFRHYSVGDLMRQIARKRNLTLLQVSRLAEKSRDIDEELDGMQEDLGRNEDRIILDSRLGWHFIPHSFRIFLKVGISEGARRIFSDRRKGEDENTTLAGTIANIRKRKTSELKRYKKYYGINPYSMKHYNLVIDTTKSTPEKTAAAIINALKKQKSGK